MVAPTPESTERRRVLAALGYAAGGFGLAALRPAEAARTDVGVDLGPAGTPRAALALNENPFGPAPGVQAALQAEAGKLYRYTGQELEALIDEVAAHEGVSRELVIIGDILEPLGIHLSLEGGAGGEFIYSDPGYTALIDAATAAGGRAVAVPLTDGLQNDLDAIAARISDRTRAVFLVNPHNPTGILADADRFRSFARSAAERTLVIVDEAYLEYAGGFVQHSLVDLVRAGANVIVFRTFDKIYGLAGLSIGYGLVPRNLAQTLVGAGANNPHLANRLSVAAARASLRSGNYVLRVRDTVAAEREKWFGLLRELKVRYTAATGNFVFFETGVPHAQFAADLRRDGIDIGRGYASLDRWARISIGLPAENALARAAVGRLLRSRQS